MKKMMSFCLIVWVLLVNSINAQTTVRQTYYVNATNGDDVNNGRSEERAFKTMNKALESAKMGIVKTITIIGTVSGFRIENMGSDEITITGKPDASEADKAKINTSRDSVVVGGDTVVKLMYVTIEGRTGIYSNGNVTLARNTVIQNCERGFDSRFARQRASTVLSDNAMITGCSDYGIIGVTVIMRDDSCITNNRIGFMSFSYESSLTMSGNAKISNNREGGVRCIDNYSPVGILTMSENAEISNNNTSTTIDGYDWTTTNGGGVYVKNLVMNGGRIINNTAKGNGGGVYVERGTLSGNARISDNTANMGGGVYLQGYSDSPITMEGGEISGNKAEYGAGVFIESGTLNHKGGTITGNEAEFIGGGVYVGKNQYYPVTYTAGGGRVTGNTSGDMGDDNIFRQ